MDIARSNARDRAANQGATRLSARVQRILGHMAPETRESFTAEQCAALDAALAQDRGHDHPIDLRVTLFDRTFLVVVAGRERRSAERRARERQRYPLRSVGNAIFLVVVSLVGLAAGVGLRDLVLGG